MNTKIQQAYVIHASSDLNEGRAPSVILGFAMTKSIAQVFSKGKGVMGCGAHIEQVEVLIVQKEDKWMVPTHTLKGLQWFDFLVEDTEYKEKVDAIQWTMSLLGDFVSVKDAEAKLKTLDQNRISELLVAYRRAKRG
jgi:hypothetical protein